MGHQRLGTLPRSKEWSEVIALIAHGENVGVIAAATARAAERSMIDASGDPTVRHAFWLLSQIPLAARQPDFPDSLRRLGINVGREPTLIEITTGMMQAVDRMAAKARHRSDLGEMTQLCAIESLNAVAGRELPDLFGATHTIVRATLAGLATVNQFTVLARDFLSRLTRKHLGYSLSRELPVHVGPNRRFASIREHDDFEHALDLHCREASRILKEFAGQWYSKRLHEGGIDQAQAGGFVHHAFQKMRDELRHRRNADG
jgi:hypothetical protein